MIGTETLRPEAKRNLKSDKPLHPIERQNRITVGWLTCAAKAMSCIGSFKTERGLASTKSATRCSAGDRSARARLICDKMAEPGAFIKLRSCASKMAEAPRNVASGAVITRVGICAT